MAFELLKCVNHFCNFCNFCHFFIIYIYNNFFTKSYELKNDVSNKFLKISYRDGYYKITYGKIGSKGKTIEKEENITKILKLIKTKEDKGYKQK